MMNNKGSSCNGGQERRGGGQREARGVDLSSVLKWGRGIKEFRKHCCPWNKKGQEKACLVKMVQLSFRHKWCK